MKHVYLSTEAEKDLERLRDFLYNQTKSKRVLNKFDSEFEKAKTSISNNPIGYPYVENKKPIRQKYQWKYWYFFIVISNQILITRIYHESENWLNDL